MIAKLKISWNALFPHRSTPREGLDARRRHLKKKRRRRRRKKKKNRKKIFQQKDIQLGGT